MDAPSFVISTAWRNAKVMSTLDELKALVMHGLESVFDQDEEF